MRSHVVAIHPLPGIARPAVEAATAVIGTPSERGHLTHAAAGAEILHLNGDASA